ncbi:hypothetical protein GCM10009735_62990 [Actinomadura chokoriensis]
MAGDGDHAWRRHGCEAGAGGAARGGDVERAEERLGRRLREGVRDDRVVADGEGPDRPADAAHHEVRGVGAGDVRILDERGVRRGRGDGGEHAEGLGGGAVPRAAGERAEHRAGLLDEARRGAASSALASSRPSPS